MTFALHAQLATWRARTGPSEQQCVALFGIGRETLQRIESGELEPEPEIIARIETELLLSGDICFGGVGSPSAAELPGRRLSHSGGPTGGGAAVTGSAAAFGNDALDRAPTHANRRVLVAAPSTPTGGRG